MMRTITCGLALLIAAVGTNVWSQEVNIAARTKHSKKLSAELVITKTSGGKLLGVTADGQAVVSAQAAALTRMLAAKDVSVKSGAEVPKEYDVVDQLLISYKGDKKPTAESLGKAGLRLIEDYKPGEFLIVAPLAAITAATVQVLDDDPAVEFAGVDYRVRVIGASKAKDKVAAATGTIPNDPDFGKLWGMRNINAPAAWDKVTTSPVIVAVIDTGVDYNHEDLTDNKWKNPDETPGDGIDNDGNGLTDDIFGADYVNDDGDPMDDNGHGTHCAGTIGGVGNNGVGVAGVTWKVQIMALKFLSAGGSGSSSDAIKCIDYAIKKKANILSNSWGGGGFSQQLKDAIDRAQDAGILFTAAAGNGGTDNDVIPSYPASYESENIIAVASIDKDEEKSNFSQFGKTSVDLAAPGRDIFSTIPSNNYDFFSGTSMATPHVSGAAALIWGHPSHSGDSWQDIKLAILTHARKLPSMNGKCVTGGTLDIGFLGNGGPVPLPPSNCCPVAAFANYPFGETYDQDANIAQVKISLDKPMQVHIYANTSASVTDNATLFTTGFFNEQDPSNMWFESLRFVSIAQTDHWVNFGSTMVVNLPKGDHVIYWKVWLAGAKVELDSGSMSVQAFAIPSSSSLAKRDLKVSSSLAKKLSRKSAMRVDAYGNRVVRLLPTSQRDQAASRSKGLLMRPRRQ